jgi:lysozyme
MDAVDYGKLLEQLIRIEGAKLAAYRDAVGNLIVAPENYVKRMGVTGTGMAVLEVDIRAVAHELEASWPTVGELDAIRKRVLIHMTFNMGIRGLLAMLRFVSAVECRLWDTAADEMLISQWAKQEPRRANVLAAMIRTGRDDVLRVIQPEAHNQPHVQLGLRT